MASPASPASPRAARGSSRALAALVDAAAGLTAAVILGPGPGLYFAERAVVMLHIGSPQTLWQGPLPMLLGTVGEVVYLLPCTLWLVSLADPITGATPGKRLLGIRVTGLTAPATASRRWVRHGIQAVGAWGATLGLIAGQWELAAATAGLGAIVLLGTLGAWVTGRPSLHDRLSRTRVVTFR